MPICPFPPAGARAAPDIRPPVPSSPPSPLQVREQRLAAEIAAAKRERDFYLSRVDRAKAIDAIKERKRAKAELAGAGAGAGAGDAAGPAVAVPAVGPSSAPPMRMRHFTQRRTKVEGGDADAREMDGDVLALVGGRR